MDNLGMYKLQFHLYFSDEFLLYNHYAYDDGLFCFT